MSAESKTFLITVGAEDVTGWQQYRVEAETADAAIAILKGGGGEFVEEELSVNQLNYRDITVTEEKL